MLYEFRQEYYLAMIYVYIMFDKYIFSSMSSGMNSVAAMGLQDIVVPLYKRFTGRSLQPRMKTTVAKCGGTEN